MTALAAPGMDIVHHGMGISLRLQQEWCMFLSSRGVADPKLSLRAREGNMPLLQFDRCVFRLQPVSNDRGLGRKADGSLRQGPVLYGKPVHIVHSYSGLYVTVIRKPAETDSTHFKVALMTLEDAGSACRFRILPRYKIRAEGDAVHNSDVVYIQQESSQLALHGKMALDGDSDELSEVTACDKPAALELSLYDTVDLSVGDAARRHHTLMAGSATMLFHREKDALLTIPSALEAHEQKQQSTSPQRGGAGGAATTLASNVSFRLDKRSRGGGGDPANIGQPMQTPRNSKIVYPFFKTSKQAVANLSVETLEITCNSLWFFEHIDPTVGGPINAGMPCRVRHGVTGKYLVAEENPLSKEIDVALRHLECADHFSSAVFELELVASSAHTLEVYSEKSFVVARHQMSGSYLTTVRSGGHSSLSLTPHLNLEDTLAIVTVPREKQQELTFLIGNVEFLMQYIKKFNAMQAPGHKETVRDISVGKIIQRAADSLSALIRFCTDSAEDDPLTREGLPLSDHQESMFQVSLHKIAMEVLLCPFVAAQKENKMELPMVGGVMTMQDILKPEYANVHMVCRLCYRLLKQMSKQSRHAALLIDYVDFMQVQEGYKLHVADTLMEVFTDNPSLPPERCETDIRHFVALLLKKGRSAGYLKFLSRLCVVNDTGITDNQRLVSHLVLDRHREDILYTTAVRNGELQILLPKFVKKGEKDKKKDASSSKPKEDKPKDDGEKPLPVWVPLATFLAEGDSKMVKFFESSIEMLGAVCIGADEECLRLASRCLPIEQLAIAIDPSFPASYALRASYFTLSLHLYLRKFLYNAMRVNNQLLERNSCGALVLGRQFQVDSPSNNKDAKTGAGTPRTLTSEEEADLKREGEAMRTIKHRALEYLQVCKSLGDVGATRLVTTVTTIWHTFVSYNAYTKDEAHDLVGAVIGVMDSRGDESLYVKNEKTIVLMGAKRSLCHFLLNILRHEESEIADRSVSQLVDGNFDAAVSIIEDGVKYLHERLFNVDKTLPILFDMLSYNDNDLVSAASEVLVAICNAGATVATRVASTEPVRNVSAARAFKVFLAAHAAMQQILSVSGNIIDEQAAIDIIGAIVNIDSSKILREGGGADTSTGALDFAARARSDSVATSGNAPSGGGIGKLKAKVSGMMAVARVFSSVREKRHRWRAEDPSSREVARLLHRSAVHTPLLGCFESVPVGSKLQVTLLEFFRILSIDKNGATELARQLDVFEKCVFHDATCSEAAAILFNIVRHNKHLANQISDETIAQLVTLLAVRRDPSFAEGLEHIVLGDFPLERVQKQVLNHILASKLLNDASSVSREWTAQQLAFNSAIVNVVACCCVNNATCRASVAKALKADDVMRILISDALPPAHLVPYGKYLCAACLSTDKESTAAELTALRRSWTENSLWATLISTSFFPRLSVPEGGFPNAAAEEFIFDGILPCLTAYLLNLYEPAVAAKARYAVPLTDLASKILTFGAEVASSSTTFAARRISAVVHALASVKYHAVSLPTAVSEQLLRDHASQQALAAAKLEESADTTPANIERADELGKKWVLNGEDALTPLVSAFCGGRQDKIFDTAIEDPKLHGLHCKLIQHLLRMEIVDDAARGLICTMRNAVAPLEDKSEELFAKGQCYLNDIGALTMVTEIVSSCSEDVAQEAFNLAIVILEGGNTDVQNSMLFRFKSTDERFFHDIRTIIDRAVQQSRNRRAREIHGAFYGEDDGKVVAGSTRYVLEVFRFLQLMCEGHHLGLQDYLRDQDDNLRSVNVIKEVLAFTNELVASFDGSETDFALLGQSLALLTEVCQGPCVGNQEQLATLGVCNVLNDILTDSNFAVVAPYEDERASQLLSMKRGAVTTLLAVMEGARDETIPLIVLQEVPVAGLEALIDQLIGTAEFKTSSMEDLCELVYGAVITLHTLVQCVSNPHHRERIAAEAVLAKHGSSIGRLGLIEIERNNQIEKVYYRVPSICALLSEESKETLLWSVDRSTQGSKLSDFLDKADELIYDIEATHRVQEQLQRNFLLSLFSRVSVKSWDDLSLGLAIVINLLFVAVISDAQGLLDKETDWFGVEGLIRVIAYGQCLCTTLILVMDSSQNLPLVLYKQSKEIDNPRWYHKLQAMVARRESLYRALACFVAFVGLFVNDFFFAVHLLGLISKSSVLKNVVVAVTQNGKSLVLTAMLGCIIVYLFSLVGFAVFQDHFEEACGTLSQCVVHVLTTGLRQGGGIGDAMSGVKHGEPLYFARLVYDTLFWAIMIVIFLNILFGIIIDTFAELRDEKSKKEEDMHTKCFICGIDSYTFDRYGQGFEKHVKEEHNMWAYLYFFHHLRRKDKNEYTGQESYVADMVERGDIGFFPAGKSSSLDKTMTENDEGAEDDEGGAGTAVAQRGLAQTGGGGGNRGGDAEPLSARDGKKADEEEMLGRIMSKLDSLQQAQQQQQQAQQQQQQQQAPSHWMSKLQDAGRKVRTLQSLNKLSAQRGESPANTHDGEGDEVAAMTSMGSADRSVTPTSRPEDSMSIREHKARLEMAQQSAERSKDEAVADVTARFEAALKAVMLRTTALTEVIAEADDALAEAYEAKAAAFAEAAGAIHRETAVRAEAAEKERELLSLEVDGLRESMASAKRRSNLAASADPAASQAYVDNMQALMREGDKYIEVLRSARRDGHGSAARQRSASQGRASESSNKEPSAAAGGTSPQLPL